MHSALGYYFSLAVDSIAVVAAYNSITTPRVQVVLLLLVAFLLNPFPASSSFSPFLTNRIRMGKLPQLTASTAVDVGREGMYAVPMYSKRTRLVREEI